MKDICVRLDNAECTEMCTDSKFGFEENSEYIIFNFKKESVRKIEVIFKTQVDRNQIAIGDLQIFYTESDAVVEVAAPSCVAMEIMEEKFEQIDNEVCVLVPNWFESLTLFNFNFLWEMRTQYNCHRQCEIGYCPSACGPEGFCYFGSQKDSSKIIPDALVKQSLLINSGHIANEESKCFRPVDEAQITWLNGKVDCETECQRSGGGPCPNACGKRGYCCKRPESTDEEIGSCPDIAKWSVLPVHDSKWRCVAPAGGFVDDSIDEERGKSHKDLTKINILFHILRI